MRKQNIGYLFDKIFWYSIYMLPLIIYIIMAKQGLNDGFNLDYYYNLGECVRQCATFIEDSFLYQILYQIFCDGGVLSFEQYGGVLLYVTYFIYCVLLHLVVDVLLFLPRWCHKMLRKGEEYVED